METKSKVLKPSQTYPSAVLLTLAGGYLDAYTYFSRGGVFANAQTGNIIKFGLNLALGETQKCIRYLIPICFFIIGVLAVMIIEHIMEKKGIRFIRRSILLIEVLCFLAVSMIPEAEETNIIANTIVSFACAMQMEAFKTFASQPIATTVSTGNLRKFIEFMFRSFTQKDKDHMKTSLAYLVIVFLFIAGVYSGTLITEYLHRRSILIPAGLLMAAAVWITVKKRSSDASLQETN